MKRREIPEMKLVSPFWCPVIPDDTDHMPKLMFETIPNNESDSELSEILWENSKKRSMNLPEALKKEPSFNALPYGTRERLIEKVSDLIGKITYSKVIPPFLFADLCQITPKDAFKYLLVCEKAGIFELKLINKECMEAETHLDMYPYFSTTSLFDTIKEEL